MHLSFSTVLIALLSAATSSPANAALRGSITVEKRHHGSDESEQLLVLANSAAISAVDVGSNAAQESPKTRRRELYNNDDTISKSGSESSRHLDSSSKRSEDGTNNWLPPAPPARGIDLNDGGCDCIVNKDGSFTCTGCGRYLASIKEDNESGIGFSRRLDYSSSKSSQDGANNWVLPTPPARGIDLTDGGCDCIVNKDGSFTCTGCGRYLANIKVVGSGSRLNSNQSHA
jgi:hypothetical protein